LKRRQQEQRSILDFVLDEAHSLERQLTYRDKQKLDEYLVSVREIRIWQSVDAIVGAIVGVVLAPSVLTRFSYAQRDAPERFELWQDSARIVRDYPVLGTGLGTYRDILPRYRPQKNFFFVAGIPQPAA
jgi:hypothetical protein